MARYVELDLVILGIACLGIKGNTLCEGEPTMNRVLVSVSRILLVAVALGAAGAARAQSANTGALTGRVTDASSRQPIAGVTVVAQGPQGEQAELTDTDGQFTITGLVPGQYVVRFYYANVKVERPNVTVYADKKLQINVPMQTKSVSAE